MKKLIQIEVDFCDICEQESSYLHECIVCHREICRNCLVSLGKDSAGEFSPYDASLRGYAICTSHIRELLFTTGGK